MMDIRQDYRAMYSFSEEVLFDQLSSKRKPDIIHLLHIYQIMQKILNDNLEGPASGSKYLMGGENSIEYPDSDELSIDMSDVAIYRKTSPNSADRDIHIQNSSEKRD